MTGYTVWNGAIPSGTSSTATGARTDGLLFTITQPGYQLAAIRWYAPAAETDLAGSDYEGLLWTTTTGASGTLVTSQAGSGTWTAGAYNGITLASPPPLSEGVTYVAGVSSPNLIQYVHNYWGFGGPGIGGTTSGPISVPGYSAAPGSNQQGNASGAGVFPGASTGSWYGVDILVTPVSSPSSGLLRAAIA